MSAADHEHARYCLCKLLIIINAEQAVVEPRRMPSNRRPVSIRRFLKSAIAQAREEKRKAGEKQQNNNNNNNK